MPAQSRRLSPVSQSRTSFLTPPRLAASSPIYICYNMSYTLRLTLTCPPPPLLLSASRLSSPVRHNNDAATTTITITVSRLLDLFIFFPFFSLASRHLSRIPLTTFAILSLTTLKPSHTHTYTHRYEYILTPGSSSSTVKFSFDGNCWLYVNLIMFYLFFYFFGTVSYFFFYSFLS